MVTVAVPLQDGQHVGLDLFDASSHAMRVVAIGPNVTSAPATV